MFVFVVITGIGAWFTAEFSALMGEVFDVMEGSSRKSLQTISIAIVICLIGSLGFELLSNILKAYNIKRMNAFLENNYVNKIYAKNIAEYNKKDSSQYESILINDVKQIQDMYIENIFQILSNAIRLALSLIVLLTISIVGTVIVCLLSVIPILLSILINGPIMKQVAQFSKVKGAYIKNTMEFLDGHDSFILYGNQDAAIGRNQEMNALEANIKRKAFTWIEALSSIVGISSISITVLTLVGGMFLALQDYITVGEVFALSFISNGISSPLMELSDKIPNFLGGKGFVRNYMEAVKEENGLLKEKTVKNPETIALIDVRFGKESRILDGINLKLQKGKKYLFMGESGSGKSTVIKTILGQYDTYEGEIYYDTVELRNIPDETIYHNITYLPQRTELFQDTVRNNISLFDSKITDEEIYKVLDFVNLKQKILSLPGKLDYCIMESKSNLSGGEKQRLSMARAILHLKPVLIMDEATSALDNENFSSIENKIANLEGVTVINILHRLRDDIVRQYDIIVEFERGAIKKISTR